jgi:hypothetical protein
MTLNGAIKQLHELREAEDMPLYFKPSIAEVINVLLMDAQEVMHGHWNVVKSSIHPYGNDVACSVCGFKMGSSFGYGFCPHCGAKMDERMEEG